MTTLSNLISGKDALIALANGEEVEYESSSKLGIWHSVKSTKFDYSEILNSKSSQSDVTFQFRIKPRAISINGIEVPAPFEPKDGDTCFILDTEQDECFYMFTFSENSGIHKNYVYLGAWRTEEEIKQVVAALRNMINF